MPRSAKSYEMSQSVTNLPKQRDSESIELPAMSMDLPGTSFGTNSIGVTNGTISIDGTNDSIPESVPEVTVDPATSSAAPEAAPDTTPMGAVKAFYQEWRLVFDFLWMLSFMVFVTTFLLFANKVFSVFSGSGVAESGEGKSYIPLGSINNTADLQKPWSYRWGKN
ncbi:hypothetical protein NEDG_01540 [Nematocida displodere]|uniref:Uncharacterized protein n=1 Tax=Nematocida displodere TaxID=1805483 RepID=A0A177EDF2_9MICR|nr:hypothetical protein NEDG_01540 [Nematocida displodere]